MLSRTIAVTAILAAATVAGAGAQAPGHTYVDDFGIETPIIAESNSLIATYYGWEQATVFGHQIYALTVDQYNTDLANGCFAFFSIYRSDCLGLSNQDLGGLLGLDLFGKPVGVTCPDPSQACLGDPYSVDFTWTPGTEIVFALAVDQGTDSQYGTPDYNWFFSGDPTRNATADGGTGYAHLAYFPSDEYPLGVPGNVGVGVVPGTAGMSLYGWEDTGYTNSDWDFDDSIFGLAPDDLGNLTDLAPEPATMALLASGLAGLALFAGRRRRGKAANA